MNILMYFSCIAIITKTLKKVLSFGFNSTKFGGKVAHILISPKSSGKIAYKVIIHFLVLFLSFIFIFIVILIIIKDILQKINIFSHKKTEIKIIILSNNAKVISNMIDDFTHPVYKITYEITKNKNDFLESIKDGNLAIINGDDISLIENNNIYFPFEQKSIDKFIIHKEVINNINATHISICRFNNGHFGYFKMDSNILEEGKNLNQTIVIGQISQSVNNLSLATITGFLANKCYVNDNLLEK